MMTYKTPMQSPRDILAQHIERGEAALSNVKSEIERCASEMSALQAEQEGVATRLAEFKRVLDTGSL